MNQYHRLLDPKKDLGKFSGTLMLYLLIMTGVEVFWQVLMASLANATSHGDEASRAALLESWNQWAGIPYFISISLGILLFNAYRKKSLLKYDLKHQGRKMTLPAFFIFLAFLGFAQVFSVICSQLLEQMFNTIGLQSLESDMGDTIERSWTMILYAGFLGPITEEFFFRGAGLRALERHGKVFAIVMSAILFGLFHANFDQLFFAAMIGLGFGYIAFEYNIWWAIFYHIFNNFVILSGLHFLAYHVDEGLANWLQIIVLMTGTVVMLVVLTLKRKAIVAYIQANRPAPGVFQRALFSFWFWFLVLFTLIMSLVPYYLPIISRVLSSQ